MTDRNPDIDLESEPIPKGLYVHHGQRLMLTARAAKIPYGLAHRGKDSLSKRAVIGLVIRNEHKAMMADAIARKHEQARQKGRRP